MVLYLYPKQVSTEKYQVDDEYLWETEAYAIDAGSWQIGDETEDGVAELCDANQKTSHKMQGKQRYGSKTRQVGQGEKSEQQGT